MHYQTDVLDLQLPIDINLHSNEDIQNKISFILDILFKYKLIIKTNYNRNESCDLRTILKELVNLDPYISRSDLYINLLNRGFKLRKFDKMSVKKFNLRFVEGLWNAIMNRNLNWLSKKNKLNFLKAMIEINPNDWEKYDDQNKKLLKEYINDLAKEMDKTFIKNYSNDNDNDDFFNDNIDQAKNNMAVLFKKKSTLNLTKDFT